MSSFYDLASLVMIPSGKKAGKVYSQKPLSTDGQLDFTRASTATRIGSDGNIEKTRTNLLLQSNSFDTTWSLNNATITSGQTGYNGSSNAWLYSRSSSTGFLYQDKAFSSSVNTASIYAKQGTSSSIRLDFVTGGFAAGASCTFDLSNGTAGSIIHYGGSSGFFATITAAGNGFYRIALTGLTTSTTWYHESALTSGNVIIQDAQLESGLVATNVITTTTAAVSVGSVDNMPRLNYTPGSATSCPSLLLEPQRTNLIPHSEYFGAWSTFGTLTLTNNYAESIEGVSNAARFQTGNSARGVIYYGLSVSSSVTYTISVFVKSVSGTNKIRIGADNGCSIPQGAETFDVTSSWTRIEKTLTSTQSNWNVFFDNVASGDACTGTYLDTDILIYGFQVEAGSYASSYIPSYGATVTRITDNCDKGGISSLLGQTEGTIFFEYTVTSDDIVTSSRFINLRSTSASEQLYLQQNASNSFIAVVFNGSNQFVGNTGNNFATKGTTYKIALAYKDSDYAFYIDGVSIETSSVSGLGTLSLTTVDFDTGLINASNQCKKLLVFKTRLSNTQLADLTSIDS